MVLTSHRASPCAGCGAETSPGRQCSRDCLGSRRLSGRRSPAAAPRSRTPCTVDGSEHSEPCDISQSTASLVAAKTGSTPINFQSALLLSRQVTLRENTCVLQPTSPTYRHCSEFDPTDGGRCVQLGGRASGLPLLRGCWGRSGFDTTRRPGCTCFGGGMAASKGLHVTHRARCSTRRQQRYSMSRLAAHFIVALSSTETSPQSTHFDLPLPIHLLEQHGQLRRTGTGASRRSRWRGWGRRGRRQ